MWVSHFWVRNALVYPVCIILVCALRYHQTLLRPYWSATGLQGRFERRPFSALKFKEVQILWFCYHFLKEHSLHAEEWFLRNQVSLFHHLKMTARSKGLLCAITSIICTTNLVVGSSGSAGRAQSRGWLFLRIITYFKWFVCNTMLTANEVASSDELFSQSEEPNWAAWASVGARTNREFGVRTAPTEAGRAVLKCHEMCSNNRSVSILRQLSDYNAR